MNKNKLPVFRITIDDIYAEDGESLGIDKIAFTKNPAIKIKGFAFNVNEPTKMVFKDDLKYRIAAPIMVPSNIYRCDTDSEYYVQFTAEEIEKIHTKYMSSPNKDLFNLEHTEERVPAYALEVMLVDSENKLKLIKDEYGIDLPMGSSFMVAQVTDKDYYKSLVDNDQIGFSIEGYLGLALSELINNNKQIKQEQMNKQEFKLQDGSTLEVFEDGTTNIIKVELADLPVEEDKVIEDIKEDAKEEEMADEPAPVEDKPVAPASNSYSKEVIDAKFDELYTLIAELKAEKVVDEPKDDVPMEPVAMSIHEKFNAFLNFATKE